MIFLSALIGFQYGLLLLFLDIEASTSFKHKVFERRSTSRTTYGHVCALMQSASMLNCARSCYETPSCQLFIHTKHDTCTCFSAFATQALPDGSTQIFGSPEYFVQTDSTIYTYDTVSKVTFYVYEIGKNWWDAQQICLADGASLISFDPKEKRQVSNLIVDDHYWIGLTDGTVEGQWTWSSNSVFQSEGWETMFNNFDGGVTGESKNNADCAVWNPNNTDRVYDSYCDRLRYFICEKYI